MPETYSSPSVYKSYLVRLWRPSSDVPWRATARHVLSGQEWHFEDIERLYLFLHEQTTQLDESDLKLS